MTVHHRPNEWTIHDLTNFTHACGDCGKTIRVVNGKSRRHWCRMPRRLRGKIGEAWADGYEWGLADGQRPREVNVEITADTSAFDAAMERARTATRRFRP